MKPNLPEPRQRLASIWNKLLELPPESKEPYRGRLLAVLLLAASLAFSFYLVLLALAALTVQARFTLDGLLDLVMAAMLLVAYSINRRGHYRVAAYMLILLIIVGIIFLGLPFANHEDLALLGYLIIPMLLSLTLFPPAEGNRITAAIVVVILIVPGLTPKLDWYYYLMQPGLLTLMAALLLVLIRRFIETVLKARLAKITANEERLRQSEAMYRQLVDMSPIPTIIHVGDQIDFVNTAGLELLGAQSPNQVLGKPSLDFVHPDQRAAAATQLKYSLKHEVAYRTAEQKLVRLDGTEIEVEAAGIFLVYNGKSALLIAFRNITSLKQQAAVAHQQRKMAEALQKTAVALSSTLELDEVLQRILEQVARIVPHAGAAITLIQSEVAYEVRVSGRRLTEARSHLPLQRIADLPHLHQMYITHRAAIISDVTLQSDCLHLSGWVRAHMGAPLCIDQEVVGFICLDSEQPNSFQADQADQLEAFANQGSLAIQNALLYETVRRYKDGLEERVAANSVELFRTKERGETILNSTSDAVVLICADGSVEQINPAFTSLFGYSLPEMQTHSLAQLFAPEEVDIFQHLLAERVRGGLPARRELQARHKNGTPVIVDTVFASVSGADGAEHMVVCSLRDVTERKHTEQELRKALEKERELSELKTRFTTMVSHEFRTPLAMIMSSSDLLKYYDAKLTPERKQEHLTTIQTSVKQLAGMLDDTLLVAQAQAVNLDFRPEMFDLIAFCQQVATNFWTAYENTHHLELNLPLGQLDISADRMLLQRLLNNLLSNAVKYSPRDSTVRFSLQAEGDQVRLCVEDNGIGIPEAEQTRIFDLFYRATNTDLVSGTGLGLTIVKEVVELHNGQIEVQSQLGVGTAFVVTLPRQQSLRNL